MKGLLGTIVLTISVTLQYFLPSIIGNRIKNATSISLLNSSLGWSLIGCVIALVWGTTKEESNESNKLRKCPKCAAVDHLHRFLFILFEFLSSEWLLTRLRWANGGVTGFLRSVLTSLLVYFFIPGIRKAFNHTRSWAFSFLEFRGQLLRTMPWFGVIFAKGQNRKVAETVSFET
jgi:cellulose synthase/poly-beta-1,6-N-acetylglucosamine synthase-like glycosyltransferase